MNRIHFASTTDNWPTPQWLFDLLDTQHGPFTLDVCSQRHQHQMRHLLHRY